MHVKLAGSIHLLLITLCCLVVATKSLLLEAEGGATTGEVRMRGSASNGASIYLSHGEYTSNSFTTPTECSVTVLNVRYSEGSTVDTATVSIDGRVIGSFRTTVSSSSADPWNDFYDSGQVGGETTLAAGEHTVKITVSTTDEYGMEVDYVQLRTTCDGANYDSNTATQDSTATEDGATTTAGGSDDQRGGNGRSSLTVGEIAGITVSVIAALTAPLVAVVLAVVKCYCRRKQSRNHNADVTRDEQLIYSPKTYYCCIGCFKKWNTMQPRTP